MLDGQCATPVPAAAEPSHLGVVEVDPVRHPDVVVDPPELVEQVHRAPAEAFEHVAFLVDGLGEVGVQPQAVAARERGGLAHQLRRHAERAARRDGHDDALAVVVAGDHRFGRGQDRVEVLDDVVGREAAAGLAQVHRASREVHADPHGLRGVDDRVEHGVVAAGHQVVVVGRGRAPGERELGEPHQRRRPDVLHVEPPPDRVELDEPAEQVAPDAPPARHPLVQVVVGVHEPRGDQVAVAPDRLVPRLLGHRPDRLDPAVADGDVARPPRASEDRPHGGERRRSGPCHDADRARGRRPVPRPARRDAGRRPRGVRPRRGRPHRARRAVRRRALGVCRSSRPATA